MKKILIISAVIIAALALTPIVGNQVIESELNKQIDKLSSSGLEIKKENTKTGYLRTQKHYELVVNDTSKFVEYLSKFSNEQISPYVKTLLDGITMGIDINYNNISIASRVSIDIYPLALSHNLMENIKKDDKGFAKYLEEFLRKGGLFYHIDYDVTSHDFSGHIKDIKESYTFKTKQKLDAELVGATFEGRGLLIAPEYIESNTKKIYLDVTNTTNKIGVNIENIYSSSRFESSTTYSTKITLDNFSLNIDDEKTDKSKVDIKNSAIYFSSNTKGMKAKFNSKLSFKTLDVSTFKSNAVLDGFNMDIDLKGIDKDSFVEVSRLFDNSKNLKDYELTHKAQKLFEKLFLRGFKLDIKDISLKNINVNNSKDLGSTSLVANIKLPEGDANSRKNSMKVLEELDVSLVYKVSKKIFETMTKANPIVGMSYGYAKEKGDFLVYDIKMNNGSIDINGKKVK